MIDSNNTIQFTKYTKSYATEATLLATIAKHGFQNYRKVIVRTPDGRWTAIFHWHNGCNYHALDVAQKGFMVIA